MIFIATIRNIYDYISEEEFDKIKKFSKDKKTPFLIINLDKIERKYDELQKNLPYAKIYYAVKANPFDEILKVLDIKGSNFDIATIYELDQLLALGISSDRISFSNTIKKKEDIEYAYKKGIRLFATDSLNDLKKIAEKAPGSKVFFRILCDTRDSDWPLSKKFGADPDLIYSLILEAVGCGLIPYGISFHVGSQQRDIGAWDAGISKCKYLFDSVKLKGIELKAINMGGGFPANYLLSTQDLETYANEITRFLKEDFPGGLPEIIIEPGRSLVAEAGVVVSEIVLVSKKSKITPLSWVYLDIGKFNGLIETIGESIKYPIFTEKLDINNLKEVILAGPTCDSMDTLYENYKYLLPKTIKEGQKIYILTTGAYTYSYCSVCFNGFSPLNYYIWKN